MLLGSGHGDTCWPSVPDDPPAESCEGSDYCGPELFLVILCVQGSDQGALKVTEKTQDLSRGFVLDDNANGPEALRCQKTWLRR